MSNRNKGLSIEASYQVSVHLAWPNGCLVSYWSISKTAFPLKPLGQMIRNLVRSIYGRSSIEISHFVLIHLWLFMFGNEVSDTGLW
jgi:hypothetical protein